jgi:NitT/TauT family transport system permease protein
MVAAHRMSGVSNAAATASTVWRVTALRIAIIGTILVAWEALAASGWLFRDVVPPLATIGKAVVRLLGTNDFYGNLGVTAAEIGAALVIGGLSGLATGIFLGANRFASRAYESLIYYLGPTPKIIFFPVMIMWFGVGAGSKIAMGAISCFFPIAINTASGMREIDRVLIRVGQSFRASTWQMVTEIYLPAMREPIVNGVRLGLGVAVIGTLLAETKLSNRGIGYLIIQAYATFDMPRMYALLIVLFVLAIGANAVIGRLGRTKAGTPV